MKKQKGIVRNIDPLGRLVIPKEIRDKLNIRTGNPVEIIVDGQKVLIRKYEEVCSICGSNTNLLYFKEQKFCNKCIEEIKATFK